MKKIYLLLSISLVGMSAMNVAAKDGVDEFVNSGVTMPGNFPHFNPQTQRNTGGGIKPNFRLVAKTNLLNNGYAFVPVDSTQYNFEIGRGGLLNYSEPASDESILFSESYTYYYNASKSVYDNKLFRKQSFDGNSNVTTLTYATWRANGAAWRDSARYLYTYLPGSNKMDASQFQLAGAGGMWNSHDQSSLTYNGNNVTSISSLSYSASIIYDANNNIISIEDKVASHGSGVLNNNEKKMYTYSNGEVATYTLEKWDGNVSQWVKNKYWEYTYNADKKLASSIEYNWNGSVWEKYAQYTYGYNTAGNMEWQVVGLWNAGTGSYENSTKEVWGYNEFGLLTSITTSNWSNNAWEYKSGNTQTNYYYEYYNPTSVSNVPMVANTISLYPIPAVNNLNIDIAWGAKQDFTVAIYDMYGKVVTQWLEAGSVNYKKAIDVSALQAGNYVVTVKGDADVLTQKFIVAK